MNADKPTQAEILRVANSAYPDDQIENVFDLATGKERRRPLNGSDGIDTLALFIGREILSVYDPELSFEENRLIAAEFIDKAVVELQRVELHLRGVI